MFPSFGLGCTLMYLANLADPKWMSIECEISWLGNVMCMMQNNRKTLVQTPQSPELQRRQKSCFVKINYCYEFLWYSAGKGKRMMIKQKERPLKLQSKDF